MAKGYMPEIRKRIADAKEGSIFSISDFLDIADTNTIRSALHRLVDDKMIRRVIRGIYEKPKYSNLLKEYVATNPDAVAKAIAQSNHWTIAPCGNTALNMLGLSSQVTATWSYISDGPYRTYELNSTKIEFKHRTNKEITGLSDITALVIQALKTLGKNNITPEIIDTLSSNLTDEDKTILLKESKKTTSWVYSMIRQICGGKQNEKCSNTIK